MAKHAQGQGQGQGKVKAGGKPTPKPQPKAKATPKADKQGPPPNKRARVEVEGDAEVAAKPAQTKVKAQAQAQAEVKKPLKSALKNGSGSGKSAPTTMKAEAGKPKFSMRLKGSPGPGEKTKEKEKAKAQAQVKSKGKARAEVEDEDEEDEDEEDDEDDDDEEVDDDEDDDSSDDEPTPTTKPKPKKTKPTKTPAPAPLPTSFKIIAGSYEKLLYGLHGTISASSSAPSSNQYTYTLSPLFIFPAHVGCIKAVAASPSGGKWLATGSADEIIKIWDLRRRREVGGLMHHTGSITHLAFPSRSHLLSASEDGTLCLFRARDWSVLRALRGHKGAVSTVAVHPSGKVALSAGKDGTLRMWDLMRGRGVASTKLGKGKEGEIVRWSSDGEMFAVQSGSTIDIYSTSMDLIHSITHPSRVQDVRFTPRVPGAGEGEGELLLVGAEDKLLSVYEVSTDADHTPKIVAVMTGHTRRVKAVQTISIALPPSSSSSSSAQTILACTVSSDGRIHVYDLAMVPAPSSQTANEKKEIAPVAEYDTNGTRLTCLALADGDGDVEVGSENVAKVGEKRKVPEGEGEGEESDGDGEGDGGDEWPSEGEEEDEEEEEEEEEDEEEAEMESD
ncbi:hypothetical protein H0H92_005547 [Tricholoma furcatifolium]|nr:hypothetical protein H0H92_005547 [Tricholoma furcatifolium]